MNENTLKKANKIQSEMAKFERYLKELSFLEHIEKEHPETEEDKYKIEIGVITNSPTGMAEFKSASIYDHDIVMEVRPMLVKLLNEKLSQLKDEFLKL